MILSPEFLKALAKTLFIFLGLFVGRQKNESVFCAVGCGGLFFSNIFF